MRIFKKAMTACAVAAVAATLCFTVFPSSVSATGISLAGSGGGCNPQSNEDCYSSATGKVYFHKVNFK